MRGFSLRRRLPITSTLFLLLAAGCAVAAFVLVRDAMASAGQRPADANDLATVIVAARDLDTADVLEPDDVREASLPAPAVPTGAFTTVEQVVGTAPVSAIATGEIVSSTRVGTGGAVARSLPSGFVAFQVPLGVVPTGLERGDRVDVLATVTGGRTYTTTVATGVRVLALPPAGQATTSLAPEGGSGAWALLLVTSTDASELASAGGYARLSLAILPSAP